jgi:small subunit ribosomal protein S6
MRFYELILSFKQDIAPNDLDELIQSFLPTSTLECKLIRKEIWGSKKLAYPIKSNKKAFYCVLGLQISNNNLLQIKNNLIRCNDILRYKIIRVRQISEQKLNESQPSHTHDTPKGSGVPNVKSL